MRPHFISTDRGTETTVAANAYWQLEQADQPDGEFQSISFYGGSKSNSRMESWWEELTSGQTKQWQVNRQSLKLETSYRIFCSLRECDRSGFGYLLQNTALTTPKQTSLRLHLFFFQSFEYILSTLCICGILTKFEIRQTIPISYQASHF
jgi:hypothetical protein